MSTESAKSSSSPDEGNFTGQSDEELRAAVESESAPGQRFRWKPLVGALVVAALTLFLALPTNYACWDGGSDSGCVARSAAHISSAAVQAVIGIVGAAITVWLIYLSGPRDNK